jgi:hypothetical protein
MVHFKNKKSKVVAYENSEKSEEKMDFHQNIYTGEKLKLFPPNYNNDAQINNPNYINETQQNSNVYVMNNNDCLNCDAAYISNISNCCYIFGLINIKKMEIIHTTFDEYVFQIDYNDILCPVTIIDQSNQTNHNIPFLFSLDSLLMQFEEKKTGTLVTQFFINNSCFHLTLKILDVCNIKGYQTSIFFKPLCNDNQLDKIFRKNCCYEKFIAQSVVMCYSMNGGKIIYPNCADNNN